MSDEPKCTCDAVYSIVEKSFCPGHGALVLTLQQSRTVNDPPGEGELCGPKRNLRICVGSLPGLDYALQGIKQELAGHIDETETKGMPDVPECEVSQMPVDDNIHLSEDGGTVWRNS